MNFWLTVLIDAATNFPVMCGVAYLGMRMGRRIGHREAGSPHPMCTCDHGYGTHLAGGGKCAAEIKRANKWDYYGSPIAWHYGACPCLGYDGPEPLPRVWTTPHIPPLPQPPQEHTS